MERLTIKAPSGLIHLKDNAEMTVNTAIKKLAEYEDLEEQGRLLKMPCAVGDTVYKFWLDDSPEEREIETCFIKNIVICENGDILLKQDAYDDVICDISYLDTCSPTLNNYIVSSTKEKAERELKEWGKKNEG